MIIIMITIAKYPNLCSCETANSGFKILRLLAMSHHSGLHVVTLFVVYNKPSSARGICRWYSLGTYVSSTINK